MKTTEFRIRYTFVSTKADGDSYTCTVPVKAKSKADALGIARIAGFHAFGARFNDNCTDWEVVDA